MPPPPPGAARARRPGPEVLRAGGGPREAAAVALVVAHQGALAIGAGSLARAIARVAEPARVPLTAGGERADPGPPATEVPAAASQLGITARELEVLALVAAGRTNRQIAAELVLSVKTAGHHVSSLLRKLDATNRGEAGARARRGRAGDEATLDRLLNVDP